MSNHAKQETIKKHHDQVDNAKIRKVKREYDRRLKYETNTIVKQAEYRRVQFIWNTLKAIYVMVFILALLSAEIYCLIEVFDVF